MTTDRSKSAARRRRGLRGAVLGSLLGLSLAWGAGADEVQIAAAPAAVRREDGAASLAPAPAVPVDAKADQLNYDRERGILEAVGHVILRRGTDELRANYVRYDVNSGDAHASGSATLTRGTQVVTGRELDYNFKSGTMLAENLTVEAQPFRVVESKKVARLPDNRYVLSGARFTTCTNAYPGCHYTLRARSVEAVPGDYVKARGAAWYLGGVPLMYWPYWYQDLKSETGLQVIPGYGSRVGAFLLNSYTFPITPSLKSQTHLDYRTKRGWAGGQDFRWGLAGKTSGRGELATYYADDKEPMNGDESSAASDIDSQRYRVKFREDLAMSGRDHVLARADYLSDPDMLKDFFEDEYREQAEPDNNLTYTHRGDNFMANLTARMRLNDFYRSVERLPEASVDIMRMEIGDSSFYYEGRVAAAYLRKVWEKDSDNEDYSAFRFDTANRVYRPMKWFGFLNMVPRAGYRGTYYSKTKETLVVGEQTTVTATSTVANASGGQSTVVTTSARTNTVSRDVERGARFRSLEEAGLETSYKAFKSWQGANGPVRHIVEPYANYSYILDPNVPPEELYQFDNVDKMDEQDQVRLGVRNKLQTRHANGPFDIIDVDVYTYYRFLVPPGEEAVQDLYLVGNFRPAGNVWIRTDADWSVPDSRLQEFNVRMTRSAGEVTETGIEYRFRREESSLLSADVTLLTGRPWAYNVYGRYEFEESRLEEVGGFIQRNLDCLALRLGMNLMPGFTRSDGTQQKDDLRFIVGIWMRAFPQTGLTGRHQN